MMQWHAFFYAFIGLSSASEKSVPHKNVARLMLLVEYTGLEPATF